jgi:hypothetical protein
MIKFFLSLVAIGVAMLIGAFVIVRPPDPFLHRPQYLHAAPTHERTLTPPPGERRTVDLTSGPFLARHGLSCDFGRDADQDIDGWSVGLAGSTRRDGPSGRPISLRNHAGKGVQQANEGSPARWRLHTN